MALEEKSDPNLAQRKFMLKVYEETQEKGIDFSIKNKVLGGKEPKLKESL